MRFERGAAIRSDALTGEVQPRKRSGAIRGKVEGKQPARHRLLVKAELAMDPAKSVLLKEQTGAVLLLPQVLTTSKFHRDRLAKFLLPALFAESVQIFIPQLDAEITTTVAATMTGIALVLQIEDLERNAFRH